MGISKYNNSLISIQNYLELNHNKYQTFKQFIINDPRGQNIASLAYRKQTVKKMIYKYWKKRKGYTIEDCRQKAEQCKSRKEMKNKYPGYYSKIIQKKWQKYCFQKLPVQKKNKGYTFNECRMIAKKCKNKHDMYLNYRGYFAKCVKRKWLDIFFKNSYKTLGYSLEECRKKAKKYKTKQQFKQSFPNHYNRAYKKKWLNEICSHMICGVQLRSISKEECFKKAKKCKSRYEFSKKYTSHYNRSLKQKWIDSLCSHMIPTQRKFEKESIVNLDKIIIKNKIKVLYSEKLWKKYKARPDRVILYRNKVYIIEFKDDRSYWKNKDIRHQISKYNLLGKAVFNNFGETILVSPKGKYGYSLAKFKEKLKLLN